MKTTAYTTNIWLPIYIGDYTADTMHLTCEQHGAYLLLILHYWRHKYLSNEDADLAVICKLTRHKWKKNSPVIRNFFTEKNGMLIHEQLDLQILKAEENRAASRSKGEKGAKARWGKSDSSANAISIPELYPSPSSSSPSVQEKEAKASKKKPPKKSNDTELDKAISAWNELAKEAGLPCAQNITEKRRQKLLARLRDCGGIEGWQAALEKVRNTPGLLGQNKRRWRVNLDFMLREDTFTKLMEGNYDGWVAENDTSTQSGAIEAGSHARRLLCKNTGLDNRN